MTPSTTSDWPTITRPISSLSVPIERWNARTFSAISSGESGASRLVSAVMSIPLCPQRGRIRLK